MRNYYYLKCKSCGYQTKIESDNQKWCQNCTQIFPNYYKKWKLENNGKALSNYQKEVCKTYSETEIKDFVNPQNKKVEIVNPTLEQVKRRAYIKEGIPLDRGGHTEWDLNQIKMFYIPVLVIIIILVLIFMNKG